MPINQIGRFTTREMTVQEMIYLYKAGQGDFEAAANLVRTRAVEPIDNLYDMVESEFSILLKECLEGINHSRKISFELSAITKASSSR